LRASGCGDDCGGGCSGHTARKKGSAALAMTGEDFGCGCTRVAHSEDLLCLLSLSNVVQLAAGIIAKRCTSFMKADHEWREVIPHDAAMRLP
jgi:hypothetical protein